jgi:hypothetical protein
VAAPRDERFPFGTQLFLDIVDIATLRALPGGREAPAELLLMLARVSFDGYELFPGKQQADYAGSKLD